MASLRDKKSIRTSSRGHAGNMTSLMKDRFFNISCVLEPTKEKFPLKNVSNEMKIKDLKAYAEFATGIPSNLQRLCYLDQGDLLDNTDMRHNDIVPGAVIQLKVWNTWSKLVEAAAKNDVEWLFELGVTPTSDFQSPNSDYMASINPRLKKQWLDERAFVALFIASHRGNQNLCEKLIQSGANVNASTPYGRSPLHLAAARGHGKIVDLLLEKGADIDAQDEQGETPLSIASKFGNKVCERHLFLFRWQQRAKQTLKNKIHVDMFAHQFFDSTNPVWLKGNVGQIYYTQILPPGEFEGTSLNAPRRRVHSASGSLGSDWREPEKDSDERSEDEEQDDLLYQQEDVNKEDLRRRRRQPDVMPAITEEYASSSSRLTDVHKKSHSAKTPGHRQQRHRKNNGSSFEEWLIAKKKDEKRKMAIKRAEEQRKQQAVEDNDYSYL